LEAFLTSTLLVALAEIGDKTQLLSFVLAARLRKPLAIVAGILVATLANHLLAGSVGVWAAGLVAPALLPWLTGLLFVGFGLWTLHPDSLGDDPRLHRAGAFATAVFAFFLAEMGDKTQLATVALGARFEALAPVVAGTTLGMLVANVPAVLIGEALAHKLPMGAIRVVAATVFILTGLVTVFGSPQVAF
jgi:putative Ca2+/H+ antiporter (TMEM165/GDT1 family)